MSLNYVGIWTIIKREIKRTIKIGNQVIWPPIISIMLYIFVFGFSLGSKIKDIEGIRYLEFLIPGLIMMSIIDESYGEGSSSLFIAKFMNSLQEMLIAPLAPFEVVIGYVIGGILRGIVIGNLVFFISSVFIGISVKHYFYYFSFMILVSLIFSSIGTVIALWAETFDNMAILSTFFITPLVFLGGVFHSIKLLPQSIQSISLYNPIFYMIDGFRYSITGIWTVPPLLSLCIVIIFTAIFFSIALFLFGRGYKIKE